MANLLYSVSASLDGFTTDEDGGFDWAAPDEQLHAFVNDLERNVGTYLYGKRMYETMVAWETMDTGPDQTPVMRDYAQIWRAAEKVVYSTTLQTVSSERTRVERDFDGDTVRHLVESSPSDISIGGPHLAAHALAAGLVDECHLLLHPVVVGGGTAVFPDHLRLQLELLDERRFDSGVIHLHYRTVT